MTATVAARRRLTALIIATAALGAGAAVAASEASAPAPATHAVAMYKEDPTCTVKTGTPLPSPGGFVPGGDVYC